MKLRHEVMNTDQNSKKIWCIYGFFLWEGVKGIEENLKKFHG
jgi:hypothetical protein